MAVPVARSVPDDFALYWSMPTFAVKTMGKRAINPGFDHRKVNPLTHGQERLLLELALNWKRLRLGTASRLELLLIRYCQAGSAIP